MSDASKPDGSAAAVDEALPKKVVSRLTVREITAEPLPPAPSYPLTQQDYNILLQGESVPAEDGLRWACVGVFVTVTVTIVGLLLTVNFADIARRGAGALGAFFGLIAIGVIALALAILAHMRVRRMRSPAGRVYADLKLGIEAHLGISRP